MITIRRADIEDASVLAQLNAIVQDLHIQQRPDHFKHTTFSELEAWYRTHLEQTTTRAWIAVSQGQPVGYVLAVGRNLPENVFARARAFLEVDQLAVDPNYRRQGIARALVSKAIAYAQEAGFSRVEAASWSFNTAMRNLFADIGFVPKNTRFEIASADVQHDENIRTE